MQQGCSTYSDSTRHDEVCVVDVAIAIDSRLVVRAEAHGAIRLHLEDDCRQVGRRRVDRGGHVEGRGGEEGPAQSMAQAPPAVQRELFTRGVPHLSLLSPQSPKVLHCVPPPMASTPKH